MSDIIKLKRGLDIKLVGDAEKKLEKVPLAPAYAVCPDDFPGVTPKMLVKEGCAVEAGSPLFFDKNNPAVMFTSPVSGTVTAVNRGEKRKLISVVVTPDGKQIYRPFETSPAAWSDKDSVVNLLLEAGLWPFIIQRPYGVIANPQDNPKAIFISGFDSAPLAPDLNYLLKDRLEDLKTGVAAMKKLTDGKVHLSLEAKGEDMMNRIAGAKICSKPILADGVLSEVKGAEVHHFQGPHPAGNVGVQIHHIDPINKGDIVWTVDAQALAIIGRFFRTGHVDMRKNVVLCGSEIEDPHYFAVISGAPLSSFIYERNIRPQGEGDSVRFINGNVLTGCRTSYDGYLGFYTNQVTCIPEGDKYELLGWAMPRFNKFSVSHTYLSWLMPWKKYDLDTNLNGGERALVVTGLYEKYLPMDIYPMYLLKAVMAGDIDKMENLGIYEVIEEDLALCEFVDPSKTEIQQALREGIDLMIKELS